MMPYVSGVNSAPAHCRKIHDSVLDLIGNTPLVRLDRLAKEENIECEILAKCEFFNPGGSVKDRIAKKMIDEGFKDGHINNNTTIIEPTSGNTGIGLALISKVMGLKALMVIPEKMSNEKIELLKALDCGIRRTPTEAPWNSPESHLEVAKKLAKEIPDSWVPDQYTNDNNCLAHYETTGEELVSQCSSKIDVFVAGAGTGGTITGTARKLKEKIPGVKIVAADPYGSILADPPDNVDNTSDKTPYIVEGIGYDFIPKSLDRSVVDEWVKVNDADSLKMARRLIQTEGLLCGGSSGAAVHVALEVARKMKAGQRLVVILPDSIRNYMTKHLISDWLIYNNLSEPDTSPLKNTKDGELDPSLTLAVLDDAPVTTVSPSKTTQDALRLYLIKSVPYIAVVDAKTPNNPIAVIGNQDVLKYISSSDISLKSTVADLVKEIGKGNSAKLDILSHDTNLSEAIRKILKTGYALVTPTKDKISSTYTSLRIITFDDVLKFVGKYGVNIKSII